LPQIDKRVGAGVRSRLGRAAGVLRDEAQFLEALAQERFEKLWVKGALSCSELLREPKALQRLILRTWLKRVRGDLRGVDFDHTEAVLELILDGPPQACLSMPGRWQFVRAYDSLRLMREARERPLHYCYELHPDETLTVPEAGVVIQTRRVAGAEAALPDNPYEAIFDCRALTAPLNVRNFRPGDRFHPFGMAGRQKKVKELLIEKKAPRTARALLPLMVMEREVLWVPGYGRSEIGRIGPASEQVLRVWLIQGSETTVDGG
jgi:tRNA(Ile)-lysidine synthase